MFISQKHWIKDVVNFVESLTNVICFITEYTCLHSSFHFDTTAFKSYQIESCKLQSAGSASETTRDIRNCASKTSQRWKIITNIFDKKETAVQVYLLSSWKHIPESQEKHNKPCCDHVCHCCPMFTTRCFIFHLWIMLNCCIFCEMTRAKVNIKN